MRARFVVAMGALLLLTAAPPAAAQSFRERVVTVPLRNTGPANPHSVTVRYLALGQTTTSPRIAVILFAGGNGYLNLGPQGEIRALAQNFLVRSRSGFAKQGFFVAVVDTPGQVPIDGIVRLSPQYAADMARVIADVRARSGANKVWLIGTSSGTLSVAGVASQSAPFFPRPLIGRRNPARADGIVLTSTQTTLVPGLCGKTVFNANLAAIRVPSFVAAHRDDGCECTPASSMPAVLAALTGARPKSSRQFTGGDPPISKDPCQALNYHGFLGIEGAVVSAIGNWIKAH